MWTTIYAARVELLMLLQDFDLFDKNFRLAIVYEMFWQQWLGLRNLKIHTSLSIFIFLLAS